MSKLDREQRRVVNELTRWQGRFIDDQVIAAVLAHQADGRLDIALHRLFVGELRLRAQIVASAPRLEELAVVDEVSMVIRPYQFDSFINFANSGLFHLINVGFTRFADVQIGLTEPTAVTLRLFDKNPNPEAVLKWAGEHGKRVMAVRHLAGVALQRDEVPLEKRREGEVVQLGDFVKLVRPDAGSGGSDEAFLSIDGYERWNGLGLPSLHQMWFLRKYWWGFID